MRVWRPRRWRHSRQPSIRTFFGPRRIALAAEVAAQVTAGGSTERGPRANAPEQALAGFLRKHNASREQLRQEGDYWVLDKTAAAIPAAALIAGAIPTVAAPLPVAEVDALGRVERLRLGPSAASHRLPARRRGGAVRSARRRRRRARAGIGQPDRGPSLPCPRRIRRSRRCQDWSDKLRDRRVIVDADERRRIIRGGIAALAEERQLAIVDDPGLLDEVAGLVEWPVPLIGRIDPAYMDLPPEVRQVSMRVNQRYFAFRNADGSAAPYFGFVANIAPSDGGAVSIAGNERVLRARFADARHFWDLDRKARLEVRVPQLDHVTFHAKLGSQGDRVRRLERLAEEIAPLVGAGPALARDARRLAKADLVTGMVGEFPELQGVMGRYYALHDGEDALVADAIRDHYAPEGPDRRGADRAGLDRRRAGRQAGSAGRLLRDRREADRLGRSVCACAGRRWASSASSARTACA